MNDLVVPKNFGALPSRFVNQKLENDLAAGIASSFGMVGYKGKVWSIRYRGDEVALMRDDGDGPRGSIEVVIVKASAHVSKIWYEQGYVEGSTEAPDCFSTNGVTPDASARNKQSHACATCPKNAWGSRITPAGKQGKACSDSKRIAVVPLADLRNETYGGPMLLRVPAASLNDLAQYGNKMSQLGYPYQFIGTRIAFNPNEAYPKFMFNGVRALEEHECEIIEEMRNDPHVTRILAEELDTTALPAQAQLEQAFEQPPAKPAPKVEAAKPAPTPAPKPAEKSAARAEAAKPKPAPKMEAAPPTAPDGEEGAAPIENAATGIDELDAQLNALFGEA